MRIFFVARGTMATQFDMRTKKDGSSTIIELVGDLDFHSARQLREKLIEFHAEGVNNVTLDMADLDFIDSSGLSVLVAGLKRLRSGGGDLTLRSVSDQTRRVLEISGLSRVLTIA